MNKVITIGREFGSGGRTIAKMTGEVLGIPVYDNELLTRMAKESGLARSYIERKADGTTLSNLIARSLSGLGGYAQMTSEDYLWQIQRKVILELASRGPCIIVGRCADFILKDQVDCLRVFIYADKEKRAKRILHEYKEESDIPVEQRIEEKDKRRSAFYRYHTDTKWGRVHNYHICLDSGMLGFEACVKILCDIYSQE